MGIVVGSAVPPIAFCITWNKISAAGAVSGALTGEWLGRYEAGGLQCVSAQMDALLLSTSSCRHPIGSK